MLLAQGLLQALEHLAQRRGVTPVFVKLRRAAFHRRGHEREVLVLTSPTICICCIRLDHLRTPARRAEPEGARRDRRPAQPGRPARLSTLGRERRGLASRSLAARTATRTPPSPRAEPRRAARCSALARRIFDFSRLFAQQVGNVTRRDQCLVVMIVAR